MLGPDLSRTEAARAELDAHVEDVWARFPVILFGKTYYVDM